MSPAAPRRRWRRFAAAVLLGAAPLAPQAAQIDAAQYAISARGFNNAIGNKQLVLIDGRTLGAWVSGEASDRSDGLVQ